MKVHQLKNHRFQLGFVPEFGCHWTFLKTLSKGTWLDVLFPVPDADNLPNRPYHDGSYVLAPWSNRLENAQFSWKGKTFPLRSNFPDGTAIHGDVWTRPWTLDSVSGTRFVASLRSSDFSDFNYPFPLRFIFSVELTDQAVASSLEIQNESNLEAPVGMGFHPFWNRKLTPDGTDAVLTLPAEKIYPTQNAIPQGPAKAVQGEYDLRNGKDLKGVDLDDGYTGLTKQTLSLAYENPGLKIIYDFDALFRHVVVFSPRDEQGVPKPFVAVEPVSNVTNGFNFADQGWENTGVIALQGGDRVKGAWTIRFEDI